MSNVILAIWFAFIGADRLDLAGGHGPVIVTPFLALTPVVIASELLRRFRYRRAVGISRTGLAYLVVAGALISLALASVFVAPTFDTSFSRVMLLVIDVVGTLAVALLALDRPDLMRVLAMGAVASLFVYVVFDVFEGLWWIGRAPELLRVGTITADFSKLQNAGPWPRFAGSSGDGNRGGFVLLFYCVVLSLGIERAWLRRASLSLAVLLLAATISRSAILGGLALAAVAAVARHRTLSPRVLFAASCVVVLAGAVALASPRALNAAAHALRPLSTRLDTDEGARTSHVRLIERGLSEATASVDRSVAGLGYGESYRVLQDVFPGNRYGNFHSLYVQMFAEAGVFALLAALILTFTPLVVGGPFRAMAAAAIAFNLFYQTPTEPTFWFFLALAWITLPAGARAADYGAFWTRRFATTVSPLNTSSPST